MPVHPTEETAPSGLTDKVAQESKDSTASDHPLHDENKGPVTQSTNENATAAAHKSKGPQIPENMPDVTGTKEELQAKAKEMNK